MTSAPTLSVLMPNYNHAHFLPVAFESVFAQSRQPDEIIVIDDASTDDSLAVLERLAARHPRFTIVRNEKNCGVPRNLNRLVELCRTSHAFFFAADDAIKPGMFERFMALLAAHPEAGLCSGLSRRLSRDGRDLGPLVTPMIADRACYVSPREAADFLLSDGQWIMSTACIYRLEALRQAGGFQEELSAFCDGLLSDVVALRHGACYIPEEVTFWRENPNGYAARTCRDVPRITDIMRRALDLMETQYADVFSPAYRERFRKFLCKRHNSAIDTSRLIRRKRRHPDDDRLRVAHVSTCDIAGGAARAAYRLHRGLRDLGVDSLMVCATRDSEDPDVLDAYADLDPTERTGLRRLQDTVHRCVMDSRVGVSDTVFTASAPGADLAGLPALREADVLILHWVSQFVSPETLSGLLDLGKPVLWVFHDLWPMTGGCHFAGDCRGYLADCRECPQISSVLWSLPPAVMEARRQVLAGRRLTVVTPSRWLADRVRESALFAGCRVEAIPNGVDEARFRPEDRARHRLGLPGDLACVLFVAGRNEGRKGFSLLLRAMTDLHRALPDGRLPDGRRLALCAVGELGAETLDPGFPVYAFGGVADDAHLRRIYAACDVFAIPTLEDNLPNTVLEAMACARPVVGFATGGVPDMVEHGVTGLLAPTGDVATLGRLLRDCLEHPRGARDMGLAGRERVEREFTGHVQAARYLDLLRDLAPVSSPVSDGPAPARELGLPREVLLQALGRDPDDGREAAKRRAFALRDAGRAADGARVLEAQLLAAPDDTDLLAARGALLAVAGEADAAVACFRRCLDLEPGRVDRSINSSDALRYAGRYEEALAALAPLAAKSPWHKGLALKRGQALLGMGACREAARALIREARFHGCARSRELLREAFARRERLGERSAVPASPA